MSDTFDRSQLDGKDREQLSEIASALGVKAISRMRKADLVDAIVTAAAAATVDATTAKPRRIRSTKPATDDLAALAAEQEALDLAESGSGTQDDMALIRPRRRNGASESGTNGATTTPPATTTETTPTSTRPRSRRPGPSRPSRDDGDRDTGATSSAPDATSTQNANGGSRPSGSGPGQQTREREGGQGQGGQWRDDETGPGQPAPAPASRSRT